MTGTMAVTHEMRQNAESNENNDEISLKEVLYTLHILFKNLKIILARVDLKLICNLCGTQTFIQARVIIIFQAH